MLYEVITPMLSLGNTYSEAEVQDFYERVRKGLNENFELVCELKYDGTSISLTYEHGVLVRAVTRGDGVKGDDVTANVKTIKSIPLRLHGNNYPDLFEIRGEILMPWSVFDALNREREAQDVITSYSIHYTKLYEDENGEEVAIAANTPVSMNMWGFVITSYSIHYTKLYEEIKQGP